MKHKTIILLAALTTACTAIDPQAPAINQNSKLPEPYTIETNSKVPGQAKLFGHLVIANGCVALKFEGENYTAIFDEGTRWINNELSSVKSENTFNIPLGSKVSATGALLRTGGSGWSVSSINSIVLRPLEPGCSNNVVRIRSFDKDNR